MTPEEFYGIYGKALAGEEKFSDAVARQKSGASTGSSAAAHAKAQRTKAVAKPNASQADTFDDSAISSVDPNAVPPAPPAAPPKAASEPPQPREPLYSRAMKPENLQAVTDAATAIPNAITGGFDSAAQGIANLWQDTGNAVKNEAEFQLNPILSDAEALRQRLLAKWRGTPPPSETR